MGDRDDEFVCMVFDHYDNTWGQELLTPEEFEKRKPTGEVMTLEQFEAMVARMPGIEERTWEEAEKYGFEETALSFDDAREGVADDTEE